MRKLLAVLAGTTLLLAACAGTENTSASDDPKGALVDALRNLTEAEGLTQTIRVESDTDSLVALGDGDLDAETADKILDSSITASGTQAENPEDSSSQILVTIAGNEDLEMRFVEGDLYMRADIASILETFGQDPAELEAMAGQLQAQPGLEWVEDAMAGDWVMLENAMELSQQMGAAAGATTFSGEQQKQLVNDLLRTVEQNATVTSEGDDDAGEHIRASLPLKDTLQDLIDSLGPAAGMAGTDMQEGLQDVPDADITLDFWVSDGTITQMGFDIVEFATAMEDAADEEFPEGVEELSLIVEIEEFDGEIEPVADAAKIDTAALGQAFAGMMGGGMGMGTEGTTPGGGGGSGAFDCSMLKGAPPEVIELYAEECPELQK
jgi:hypothetical protein